MNFINAGMRKNMLLHFWTTGSGIVCFILFWSNFGVWEKTLSLRYIGLLKYKQTAGDRYLFWNGYYTKVSLRRGIVCFTTVTEQLIYSNSSIFSVTWASIGHNKVSLSSFLSLHGTKFNVLVSYHYKKRAKIK